VITIAKTIQSDLSSLVGRNKNTMLIAVRSWFYFAHKQIRHDLTHKFIKDITSELSDWGFIEERGREMLKPATLKIMQTGGNNAYKLLQVKGAFDVLNVNAVTAAEKFTAELVREVTKKTKMGIRTYIKTGIKEGRGMPKIARELRPLVGLTENQTQSIINYRRLLENKEKYPKLKPADINKKVQRYAGKTHRRRAATIARTETARAQNIGYVQGLEDVGVTEVEFSASPGACGDCLGLDETRYSAAEAKGIIPVHPNCLPGDSLISPRGRITAASKRWYKGKIHIIKTATGRIIRATPNHPILSNRGFVPANSLDIGSQVISHGLRQGESFSDWQDINKPTTIEDIAESFFASPGVITKEVPVSAPDFHYDGTGSNIAIIGTDSLLSDGRNASNKQLSLNNNLVFRDIAWSLFDRFCMFAFGRPAYSPTLSRIMSSFNLFLSLLKTHLRPFECFGLALVPDMNTGIQKTFANTASAISKMQSNTIFGPSGNVQIDNLCNDFFVDSVVHINSFNFSNYVYNLETTESYYIANGIASHNCRCAMLPVVNDLPPCQGSPGEVANASCIMPDRLHDGQVQSLLNKLEEAGPAESSKISRALRKLGHKGGLSGKPPVGKIPTVKPTKPVVAKPKVRHRVPNQKIKG